MKGKVWFINGTSKGFGRVWAEAALARGDRVAATAMTRAEYARRIEMWEKWNSVSLEAQGDLAAKRAQG